MGAAGSMLAAQTFDFPCAGKFPSHSPEWQLRLDVNSNQRPKLRAGHGPLVLGTFNPHQAARARVAPWARSVIVCAINYNTAHPYSTQGKDASRGWISRYAWSRQDYHDVVLGRLRKVEDGLRGLLAKAGGSFELRSYVDTGPLIERVFAKYAGIGWIGKNTCIINQQLGSWLFLGVILTS